MSDDKKKANELKNGFDRRKFIASTAVLSGLAGSILSGTKALSAGLPEKSKIATEPEGELLYNGIRLPSVWPPKYMKPKAYDPMPVPYLTTPPDVILVDVGRQLFVDDFLIERTTLTRQFHQPVKQTAINPILKPETAIEKNQGYCPMAAAFSDGCFYDPEDKLFKLWYMAGWFDGTALATSKDGIHWDRPKLDVVKGTNLVLPPKDDMRRDGVSVWLDHQAKDPAERFKMYLYARQGQIGKDLKGLGGYLLTSSDGIHWNWRGHIERTSDNNTFFYNPFRNKWVFTIRKETRPSPPWSEPMVHANGRARSYWEGDSIQDALSGWDGSVFWFGADRLDPKKPGYPVGDEPQIYKVDAVGYESLMLGLIQPHYGPANEVCAKKGYPKLTELEIAFSRDGFHWDRNRKTFIGADVGQKESWERGYIHSIGGVCNIVGDNLHFYYTAFQGNEANLNPLVYWNGLYANGAMGLAILRRDGFASMEAGVEEGVLLTRKLTFKGSQLFVNIDAVQGNLTAEICDENGDVLPGFSRKDCVSVSGNHTKTKISWKGATSLESLAGKVVRIKFFLVNGKFYAFWISKNVKGASGGATAAGGPGLSGTWDI